VPVPTEVDDVSPPTKLRSERALKIGGIALSSFGVLGGLIGLADGDILKVLLGFADLILGAIFYAHTKTSRSN
jgi:hypothetical protein